MSTWWRRSAEVNSWWPATKASKRSTSGTGTAIISPDRPSAISRETVSRSAFLNPLCFLAAVTAPSAAPPRTAPTPMGPLKAASTRPAAPPSAAPRAAPGSTDLSVVILTLPPGSVLSSAQSQTTTSFFAIPLLSESRTLSAADSSSNPRNTSRIRSGWAIVCNLRQSVAGSTASDEPIVGGICSDVMGCPPPSCERGGICATGRRPKRTARSQPPPGRWSGLEAAQSLGRSDERAKRGELSLDQFVGPGLYEHVADRGRLDWPGDHRQSAGIGG